MTVSKMEKLFGKHKRLSFVSIGKYVASYISDKRWSWQQCKRERDAVYFRLEQFADITVR